MSLPLLWRRKAHIFLLAHAVSCFMGLGCHIAAFLLLMVSVMLSHTSTEAILRIAMPLSTLTAVGATLFTFFCFASPVALCVAKKAHCDTSARAAAIPLILFAGAIVTVITTYAFVPIGIIFILLEAMAIFGGVLLATGMTWTAAGEQLAIIRKPEIITLGCGKSHQLPSSVEGTQRSITARN